MYISCRSESSNYKLVLLGCIIGIRRVLHGCYMDITRVVQGCFNGVSYKGLTRVLQECFKGVSMLIYMCYEGFSRVFQGF